MTTLRINMRRAQLGLVAALCLVATGAAGDMGDPQRGESQPKALDKTIEPVGRVERTDEEWRKILTPEQYRVLREKGTERAWTGKYNEFKKKGTFICAGCGNPVFRSDTKFDSGTGWPSFWSPIAYERVTEKTDRSHGMLRIEVLCARCDGHLGHVFEDGPKPTRLRYCINSVALDFVPDKEQDEKPH